MMWEEGLNTQFKRFMYFEVDHYYPSGGVRDCKESFDTLADAVAKHPCDHAYRDFHDYIFDRIEGKVVAQNPPFK